MGTKQNLDDQRRILICFADAAEQSGEPDIMVFSAKVQTMMGMSVSRKIQALCYLFDNLLQTNAKLTNALNEAMANIAAEEWKEAGAVPIYQPITKEDAFAALQMALTAQLANWMNGDNE